MNVWSRTLVAVAAGVALVGVAGCGPGGLAGDTSGETSTESNAPPKDALASVKPCQILPPETLQSFGLEVPGEPKTTLSWKPGCYYEGEPVAVTLYKNTKRTVAAAEKQPVWAMFERTQVNGRPAATAIAKGATQARICDVMFDAGQGTIQVSASEPRLPDDVDECAKALEIAKKIEPNVPEPA